MSRLQFWSPNNEKKKAKKLKQQYRKAEEEARATIQKRNVGNLSAKWAELLSHIISKDQNSLDNRLLEMIKDIDKERQARLLHIAIEEGSEGKAKKLLEAIKDKTVLNYPDGTGKTPVHIAVKSKRVEIVEALLEAGAGVDFSSEYSKQILPMAVNSGSKGIVKEVGNMKIAIDTKFKIFSAVLHDAVINAAGEGREQTYVDTLEALLGEINKMNEDKKTKILDVRDQSIRTPLHVAADKGNLYVVNLLLKGIKGGIKSDEKRKTVLNAKDVRGKTPLHIAVSKEYGDIVGTLLEAGANKDARDKQLLTPLHYAAIMGYGVIVGTLLKAEADVNAQDDKGQTPLDLAIRANKQDVIKILSDSEGTTALHKAVWEGNSDTVQKMLGDIKSEQNKKNVLNAKDGQGHTPLHLAVMEGHFKVVKLLIENGANVNAQDNKGYTPLHYAVMKEPTFIKYLLDNGADVNAQDDKGQTPLDLARTLNNESNTRGKLTDIINLLMINEIKKGFEYIIYKLSDEKSINRSNITKFMRNTDAFIKKLNSPQEGAGGEMNEQPGAQQGAEHSQGPTSHQEPVPVSVTATAIASDTTASEGAEGAEHSQGSTSHQEPVPETETAIPSDTTALEGLEETHEIDLERDTTDLGNELIKIVKSTGILTPKIIKGLKGGKKNVLDARDEEEKTPLHIAIEKRHYTIANFLLNFGANVNAQDNKGYTPLHYAVMKEPTFIKYLLKFKANVNAQDNEGYTPLDYAKTDEIKQLLAGANPMQISSRKHFHRTSLNKDGLIILLALVNKGNKSVINDLYNCVMGRNERAKKRLVDKMTHIYMINNNKHITKHKGATKRKVVKRKVYRNPKTGSHYHMRKSKTTGRMYKQYLPRK